MQKGYRGLVALGLVTVVLLCILYIMWPSSAERLHEKFLKHAKPTHISSVFQKEINNEKISMESYQRSFYIEIQSKEEVFTILLDSNLSLEEVTKTKNDKTVHVSNSDFLSPGMTLEQRNLIVEAHERIKDLAEKL